MACRSEINERGTGRNHNQGDITSSLPLAVKRFDGLAPYEFVKESDELHPIIPGHEPEFEHVSEVCGDEK